MFSSFPRIFVAMVTIVNCLMVGQTAAEIRLSSNPIWQVSGSYPTGLGWADFNGNGWMDLVVTQGLDITNSPNFVFFNEDGEISTVPGWTSSDRKASNCVFVGDLDNDGDPDLTVANLGLVSEDLPPLPQVIYFNDDGLSSSPGWLSPPGNAFPCTGGDPDGDGDLDIVFGQGHWLSGGLQNTRLFTNNGGVFDTIPGWETDDLHQCGDAFFGDVDRDGDLDLALGWGDSTGIALYYNHEGMLETTPSWSTNVVSGGSELAFGDVDNDGFLDLAVADGTRGFFLFENVLGVLEATPSWSVTSNARPSAVAWADIDADGDLDLAAGSWQSGLGIFENRDGILTDTFVWSYPTSAVQQIAWGDLDEDGLVNTLQNFVSDEDRKLLYLAHAPAHEIHSVSLNGSILSLDQYCFDPLAGWISLGFTPQSGDTLCVAYTYSLDLDLAVTDWQNTRIFENRVLLPPYLIPDFEAVPNTGHAPLTAQFTDISNADPGATSWDWDFDNDGITDATGQTASWTYATPGSFTVMLEVSSDSLTETVVKDQYIDVFDGESAICFDGSSSEIRCAASPSLCLSEALTIEAFINPTGWGEVSNAGYGRVGDKNSFALYLNGEGSPYNDHSLILLLKHQSGPPVISTSPIGSIRLDEWQHVAATYDAAGNVACLYINGLAQELTQSGTPSGPVRDNAAFDFVMGNSAGGTNTFDGVIDEIRLWDHVRTGDELRENMGRYLNADETGIVGYWRLNEGNGVIAIDWSQNGHDGNVSDAVWVQGTPMVPVDENPGAVDHLPGYALHADYPNPFYPSTTIEFSIPSAGNVDLRVYNLSGELVRTLVNGFRPEGTQAIVWDGKDNQDRMVSSGIYFYSMKSGSFRAARKCLLLK